MITRPLPGRINVIALVLATYDMHLDRLLEAQGTGEKDPAVLVELLDAGR